MINFSNGGICCQSVNELPIIYGNNIILDFETTSGNDKLDSLNPWHHCKTLGICIGTEKENNAYYVPIGHRYPSPYTPNLSREHVRPWLVDIIARCRVLIGHSIKYDMHILKNDWSIDYRDYDISLYDTLTQAKLVNSDLFDYALNILSKQWLNIDISQYENRFTPYLFDGNGKRVCKDYGMIPIEMLSEYGCQDIITTRKLKQYIQKELSSSCQQVSETELALTNILFGIEQDGMHINPVQVSFTKLETLQRLQQIIMQIRDITGIEMRPNSPDDCYKFLCGQYGLPILEWTNEDDDDKQSNPSFNKKAMASYLAHPRVQEDKVLKECVELIQEFRVLDTFNSLFLNTYTDLHIDGVLHPSYNQCVRTGRLSCSSPNTMQLSSLAKGLIIPPDDDWVVVDIDLSQIEFRLIASTINNTKVIDQYQNDPSTDYHEFVAKLANLKRKPAKNLNFAVAFGAGKKKAISMVKGSLDISAIGYTESGMGFDEYCQKRAENMYTSYHRMLPELKPTMQQATNIARARGYISNIYGRHRHIATSRCFIAFNSYIQSSAADIAKSITLKIAEYCAIHRDTCRLIGVVHDSWVFYMRKDFYLTHCLVMSRMINATKTPRTMRVPIRCSVEIGKDNWKNCCKIPNWEFS